MTGNLAAASAQTLIDPGLAEPVFALARARPGSHSADIPRFGAMRWDLTLLEHRQSSQTRHIDWERTPPGLRDALKRATWALINLPTPEILRASRCSTRLTLSGSTIHHVVQAWRELASWAQPQGISTLNQITPGDLEDFATATKDRGRAFATGARILSSVSRLWALAPFLLPEDRLVMPPWEAPDVTVAEFLGTDPGPSGGENAVTVIHPAVMSPLLTWSIRMILDLAPDILAAQSAHRECRERTSSDSAPDGIAAVRDWLRQMIAAGRPIPTNPRPQWAAADSGGPRRKGLGITVIAGTLGVSQRQVSTAAEQLGDELRDEHLADGAPLDVPVTGRIGDRSWTSAIDHYDVPALVAHLSTAVMITVAYLSGMRPAEVLHLEHGCCTRLDKADGTTRFLINGLHFKTAVDEHGDQIPGGEIRPDPWVVNELVHTAIAVQEQLIAGCGPFLFPRSLTAYAKPGLARGDVITTNVARENITRFTAFANELAAKHDRPHELIPADPDGRVVLRRLRRTLAWFIYSQPGGRIALGVQYGHIGTSLGESYAGRSKTDMLHILDYEKSLAMADTLATAAERLDAGEGVSGPATGRYLAAVAEFQAKYAGGFTGGRGLKTLRSNPRLQVFEHPSAVLTCNYDPFKALCARPRPGMATPTPHGPDPASCDTACANISRTDIQVERHRAEVQQIDAELAAGLAPRPLAGRQQQRKAKLLGIIATHESTRIHRNNQTTGSSS